MNIHEYQSKRVFAQYGVPIPEGEVATTPTEARVIAQRLGTPVVVKAQVLVGGRGKAGGIKLARTPSEAEEMADQILGMTIKGLPVKRVLVDRALDIQQELYLGLVIDRAAKGVVMMASAAGGIDIEEVAATMPEKIFRAPVDPFLGLQDFQARALAYGIGLDKALVRPFTRIAHGLYQAFVGSDASLAEINPLVVTADGRLVAADGKMNLDDSALFRHKDLEKLRDLEAEDPYEREARLHGLSYVKLDGDIGCMVNGAGLAMATMDIIKLYGGSPANFLDIGGGAQAERVAAALRIILSDKNVKAVLLNIFGGITRCDEVARGVLAALQQVPRSPAGAGRSPAGAGRSPAGAGRSPAGAGTDVPMVARLVGTNEEEGRRLLAETGMITAATLEEAARKAVGVAQNR